MQPWRRILFCDRFSVWRRPPCSALHTVCNARTRHKHALRKPCRREDVEAGRSTTYPHCLAGQPIVAKVHILELLHRRYPGSQRNSNPATQDKDDATTC